jgi:transposase
MTDGARDAGRPVVSHDDRRMLERWVRMPTATQRLVLRSRIVLLLADGCPAREVARRLGVSRPTVALWRRRYAEEGCDALTRDRPGRGRKRSRTGERQPLVAADTDL